MRTLLRTHSLLRTFTKVFFDKKHRPLLKLQYHQRMLNAEKSSSDSLIYYSSADDKRTVLEFTKTPLQREDLPATLDDLSPRSQRLRNGLFSSKCKA